MKETSLFIVRGSTTCDPSTQKDKASVSQVQGQLELPIPAKPELHGETRLHTVQPSGHREAADLNLALQQGKKLKCLLPVRSKVTINSYQVGDTEHCPSVPHVSLVLH